MSVAEQVSQPKPHQLIVEKDVKIPLRDGTVLYADIFRPETGPACRRGRDWRLET